MVRLHIILIGLFFAPFILGAQTCTNCDTTFYYRKKPLGELEKLYPTRIICYFQNENGPTDQKCFETEWKEGKQNGVEKKFIYEDSILLRNLWGKSFKANAAPWRKKIFGAKVQMRPLEYKGYWKDGKKNFKWYYYDHSGRNIKVARYEVYKNGVLKKAKQY